MAQVIASCGHDISWEWFDDLHSHIIIKRISIDHSDNALMKDASAEVVCVECLKRYQEKKIILQDKKSVEKWLSSGSLLDA